MQLKINAIKFLLSIVAIGPTFYPVTADVISGFEGFNLPPRFIKSKKNIVQA